MQTRLIPTTALVLASALLLVSIALRPDPFDLYDGSIFLWGTFALVVAALVATARLLRRPWQQVERAMQSAGYVTHTGAATHLTNTPTHFAAAFEQLHVRVKDAESRLVFESEARLSAERKLREATERYDLAVRGASEGLWEWDIATGEVYFSPLWKSLLGYDESEIGNRIDEWHNRIHPEDLQRVQREMTDHLEGVSSRFDSDHRILHRDESWHWVHARGMAIRRASGKPYRVVGLHSDITARRVAEQVLLEVADSLAMARGEACFQVIAASFARVMGVREAFVCEPCDHPPTRARMLAWWCDGRLLPNVEYDLEGTPCKNPQVLGRTCYCSRGLEEQWPLEKPLNRKAYLGIPIYDSAGGVIGHMACTDNKPMPERTPHLAIFRLFAERASVELERRSLCGKGQRAALPPEYHAPVH